MWDILLLKQKYIFTHYHIYVPIYLYMYLTELIINILTLYITEIPRVISAVQQQNTAPEPQSYDPDAVYRTDRGRGK